MEIGSNGYCVKDQPLRAQSVAFEFSRNVSSGRDDILNSISLRTNNLTRSYTLLDLVNFIL